MTPTEKQKCIAEQSVYQDLLIHLWDFDSHTETVLKCPSAFYEFLVDTNIYTVPTANQVKPILRPLSDLTAEITHKGYNEDKSFVPLVELAKVKPNYCDVISYQVDVDGEKIVCITADEKTIFYVFYYSELSIEELDLLHLWHFDTRSLIKKGEAIDVNTLDINPYSVQL